MSAARTVVTKAPAWRESLRKWAFNLSGWNKYGLLHDDILYEDDVVQEAIRRLPENVRNERIFRIIRATQLDIVHDTLPKEQWTKYEDDVRYLQPLIDEVVKENDEKSEWNSSH